MKFPPSPLHCRRRALLASVSSALALMYAVPNAQADPITLQPVSAMARASAEDDTASEMLYTPQDPLPYSISLLGDFFGASGSAAAAVNGGSDPSIIVSAAVNSQVCTETPTTVSACGNSSGATADLGYEFAIEGPTTTSSIPVLLQGSESLSEAFVQPTMPNGTSLVTLSESTADLGVYTYSGSLVTSQGGAGAFNDTLQLTPGAVYFVDMRATVLALNTCLNTGTVGGCDPSGAALASASVDPTFTIDPTFANEYSIEFSPGLLSGAGAPVPEPDSALLLLGGVVALAIVRRRRRG